MRFNLVAARRLLRIVLVLSIAAAAGLTIVSAALVSFGYVRGQFLLTFIGLIVGAIIGDIALGGSARFPWNARICLGSLVTSQLFYYVLIWTIGKEVTFPWRLWWISMVAAVTSVHLLGLRLAPQDRLARVTLVCAGISGTLLASLALRPDMMADVSPLFLWMWIPPAAGSVLGSILIWSRAKKKAPDPRPMPRWAKACWAIGLGVGIFLAGVYVGRGPSPADPTAMLPSSLAGIPAEEIDRGIRSDLKRLKRVFSALQDLSVKAENLKRELTALQKKEGREYFRPEEEDRIRWLFVTYLSQRSALLRQVATYADYQSVREPDTRARCFMLGYAAGVSAFEAGLSFVHRFGDTDTARRKLNEKEPLWGLKDGMFDRVHASVAGEANLQMCHEMGAYYMHHQSEWKQSGIWPEEDFAWLDRRISEGLEYVRENPVSRPKQWFSSLLKQMKEDAYRPVYKAQSILSCWIGDTRIVENAPLITDAQIRNEVRPMLQPGDLILERRNWYLSNAFLPGFWPHGALYVGKIKDLKALGIAGDPEVKSRLTEFLKPGDHGEAITVIESVSEGVVFNTLTHSMRADHVAVLRPRLTREQIARAIVKAFSHQGKPYDYEFDFFTSDKLVCTELLYRSYEGLLHFDLVKIMGRDTLPAVDIVRKFARERGKPDRELDFVLFLDGRRQQGRAVLADEDEFCASANRKRAFNE